MAISIFSLKTDATKKLSENFKVSEFACKDGSDKVLIDSVLVNYLQKIRSHFKKALIITSAYRSNTYNKKIGGSANSYHTKGRAADIYISGINPLKIAAYAQSIGVPGIGLYTSDNFVHIDTRGVKYFFCVNGKNSSMVGGFGGNCYKRPSGSVKRNDRGDKVKWVQWWLVENGQDMGSCGIDGIFGGLTESSVKSFQRSKKLSPSGIADTQTQNVLES